jgi:isopenicillin-N epimerase
MQRRSFLTAAITGVAALRPDSINKAQAASRFVDTRKAEDVARDEDYWREIQQAFTVDRNIVNLNNGGVCPSPKIVQDAMRRALEFANNAPAYSLWSVLEPEVEGVRQRLANMFGADPEEIAITRNASEALEIAQLGIQLNPGDEVLTTDQDYGRMLTTWKQRERRDGIVMKQISFPTPPPSLDDLYQRFEQAITPKTKVILMCHITNLTGQIFPVKKISQMARQRGILTIVDGAHAFAHFSYKYADLDCDYYGTSLHKWMLAPHGTGFLFVRKDKIASTWPLMAADKTQDDNIRKFEEIGTHPAANHNAISEAITFHEGIGADRKLARLRYLRSVWSDRLTQIPGVTIRTSPDPAQSGGLALVEFKGRKPNTIAEPLWNKYRVLVTGIEHKDFAGLRVTPNVYTTLGELDIFCSGVEKILKS